MKPPQRALVLFGVIAMTVLGLAGCRDAGDDLPREPISGTVTFDGQPLKLGTIQFHPSGTQEGIAAGGFITEGRFDVARKDGPVPGTYSVMIFARKEGPEAAAEAENAMPGEIQVKPASRTGLIPIRYNFETELKAEVKPGGPNTYTFSLEKK